MQKALCMRSYSKQHDNEIENNEHLSTLLFYVYPTDDELTDGNREKVASSVFLFYFLFLITFTSTLTLRIHKMWSIKW